MNGQQYPACSQATIPPERLASKPSIPQISCHAEVPRLRPLGSWMSQNPGHHAQGAESSRIVGTRSKEVSGAAVEVVLVTNTTRRSIVGWELGFDLGYLLDLVILSFHIKTVVGIRGTRVITPSSPRLRNFLISEERESLISHGSPLESSTEVLRLSRIQCHTWK